MSSISERHKEMIECLFDMQRGYFFGFSNRTFRSFMLLNADIDVYEATGYVSEGSKANKFRYFLASEPDELVGEY